MKKKKKEIKKPNTPTKRRKSIQSREFFHDIYTYQQKPMSIPGLQKMGAGLIKWALEDPKALKIKPFFRNLGIATNDVSRWRKKYPAFDMAYRTALEAIGDRREIGAIEKKYDSSLICRTMVQYDSEWAQTEEWRAGLRTKEEDKGNHTFVINMPSFEEMKKETNE